MKVLVVVGFAIGVLAGYKVGNARFNSSSNYYTTNYLYEEN